MNRGLEGCDEVRGNVVLYRSPPVRLNKYMAGKRYSIPHPFPRRPAWVRPVLTCRIAEAGYNVGDETIYTPTDASSINGAGVIYRPDEIIFILVTGSFQLQLRNSNTLAITPASWDLSFAIVG
jgi:hypothetical protein